MTNSKLWNRIKNFFTILFGKKEKTLALKTGNENSLNNEIDNKFIETISIRDELKKQEEINQMAQKLLNNKVSPYELTEDETDNMTQYFYRDIEDKKKELENVREHILSMRKQLETLNNK